MESFVKTTICTLVTGLALQGCVSRQDLVDDFYYCQEELSKISNLELPQALKSIRGPRTDYTCAKVIEKYWYGG